MVSSENIRSQRSVINASLVSGLSGPFGIAVAGGEIYEVNQANQTVESFSAATGAPNPAFTTINIAGASPSGIAFLRGFLYVVEQANDQVSEWNTDGTLVKRDFINSSGVTIAGFGNDLYITTGSAVAEYNATTGAAINANFITGLTGSFGVSLTPDGSTLYVTNNGAGTVGEYNAITGAAINASLITGLDAPLGIYAGLAGPTLGIYWDIPSGGPSGTWNTTDAFWSASSAGGAQIAWKNGSDAVFSAADLAATGNFTVTLGENLSVGNLTYRGGTAGSTLDIAVGVGNTITMANATMNVTADPGTILVIDPVITGAGTLVLESGTLVLTGADTYSGGTTISAGTLQIGNGGITGSITGDVLDNGNLAFNRSDPITFSGLVSGTGTLTQKGLGILTLTNLLNSYAGGTIVSGGVLSVVDDAVLGSLTGGITLQGGELLTTALNFNSARAVTLNLIGTANILAAVSGGTAAYTGIVSGAGKLQVGDGTNTGTVVLASGGNAYLGGTTVTGGATLSVDTDAELGNSSGGITLQGGKLVMTTSGFSTERTLTLLGVGPNTLAAPNNIGFWFPRFTGLVTGAGGLTVGDTNSAHLFLTLTDPGNNYAGGTTVTGGATLEVNTDTELGTGGITLQGGTLNTTANGFLSERVNLISGPKPNVLAAQSNTTATYTGPITGSGGLTIGSGGTVVLANAGNSYMGGTTVQGSTLSVDSDAELGNLSGGLTLNGGRILTTVDGFASARSILLNRGEGNDALAAAPGTTATYTGPISGGAPFTVGFSVRGEVLSVNQDGIVVLTNLTNSYTGGTTITAGATLSVDADAELGATGVGIGGLTLQGGELLTTANGFTTARTINLRNGTDILAAANGTTATYTGVISGDGVVLMIGDFINAGTIVLSGNNTYNGGTEIKPGTLVAASDNALGTGPVELFSGTLVIPADVTLPNQVKFVEGGRLNNAGTLNNSITDAFSVAETVINSGTINGNVSLAGLPISCSCSPGAKSPATYSPRLAPRIRR